MTLSFAFVTKYRNDVMWLKAHASGTSLYEVGASLASRSLASLRKLAMAEAQVQAVSVTEGERISLSAVPEYASYQSQR